MPTPVTRREEQADPVFHVFQASSKPLLVILKVYLSNQTGAMLKTYQKRKRKKVSKNEVYLCQRELLCHLWQKALVLSK